MNTAILINECANNHTGGKNWALVRNAVLQGFPSGTKTISYRADFDMKQCVRDLITEKKINCIISAGGDGSIHVILNAVIACLGEHAEKIHLGAIGLGSSNDFLKPFNQFIAGIPVKIGMDQIMAADIGKVRYIDEKRESHTRYFIVNSSIGVTAEANLLFNRGDFFISRMKNRAIGSTILYSALKTILTYHNQPVEISYNGVNRKVEITNVSVVKNPNVSGNFRYDQDIKPNDGYLGLNYSFGLNKWELLRSLYDLSRGRFSGKAKRCSVLTTGIKISADHPLALETDGEVTFAKTMEFSIIPAAINLLG
jgi:diacylglycerol kinase family enzyme